VWRGRPRPRNAYRKIAPANSCRCVVLFAALTVAPFGVAQRASAPSHGATPTLSGGRIKSAGNNFSGSRSGHRGLRHSSPLVAPFGSLPFPFFGDTFNPDDIYSGGYPVASQPPPFLMDAVRQLAGSATNPMAQAMTSPSNHRPDANDPLMIELKNGRYVRVDSVAADGEAEPLKLPSDSRPDSRRSSAPAVKIAASPAQRLAPAILIFRDGHSEEVRDYTIADGVLYARGDYYTDGYWNKKIDLAGLNVAETEQANATRNVKFILPSSPNEVITRP
jgi:hypothetical protein